MLAEGQLQVWALRSSVPLLCSVSQGPGTCRLCFPSCLSAALHREAPTGSWRGRGRGKPGYFFSSLPASGGLSKQQLHLCQGLSCGCTGQVRFQLHQVTPPLSGSPTGEGSSFPLLLISDCFTITKELRSPFIPGVTVPCIQVPRF